MTPAPPIPPKDENGASLRQRGPWQKPSKDAFFNKNVEAVLPATTHLPVRHWRPGMFFMGAEDQELVNLTGGRFPATPLRRGSHPVFSLKRLRRGVGCTVCPCSSKRPYGQSSYRWIRRGCELLHTGHVMDWDSFLIQKIRFNIPPRAAHGLRFRGEAPDTCIRSWKG